MPRIDIELTSSRPDGTWTWRAAGARQPKGVVEASVLHEGAKVGDVLKAEADFDLEGINVTAVTPPKARKPAADVLPVLGSGREEELVTHSPLQPEREGGDRGRRSDRGDRGGRNDRFGPSRPGGPGTTRPRASDAVRGPAAGPRDAARRDDHTGGPGPRDRTRPDRGDRAAGGGPRGDRTAGDRPGGARPTAERPDGERPRRDRPPSDRPRSDRPPSGDRQGRDRPARDRPARAEAGGGPSGGAPRPPRPAAKRLQPGRAHRDAVLAQLPPEQRAIAEQVLRGGMAGVRQAVEEQNNQARAAGGPGIRTDAILALAEQLLPGLRAAEWRDRAEAAVAAVDEISLRDLRTVVAGADGAGRDEESRALATTLRDGLERRSGAERQAWVHEIRTCLAEGRVVRALRVSGRAPEQGLRLPPEVADGLSGATGDAMTTDTAPDRWLALLEAVLASPIRRTIAPRGLPAGVDDESLKTIRQAVPKVPALASLLGEAPGARPVPPPPLRRPPPPTPPHAAAAGPPAPPAEPAAEAPVQRAAAAAEEPPPADVRAEGALSPEMATSAAEPGEGSA